MSRVAICSPAAFIFFEEKPDILQLHTLPFHHLVVPLFWRVVQASSKSCYPNSTSLKPTPRVYLLLTQQVRAVFPLAGLDPRRAIK